MFYAEHSHSHTLQEQLKSDSQLHLTKQHQLQVFALWASCEPTLGQTLESVSSRALGILQGPWTQSLHISPFPRRAAEAHRCSCEAVKQRITRCVFMITHTHCLYIYKASNQGCYFCLETSKLLFLIFILILSLWSVVISSHKSRKRHFRHSHMLAWDQTQHHFCALWKWNLQKIMFFLWDPPKIDCPLTNKWFQKVNDPLGEEKTEFNGISLYY